MLKTQYEEQIPIKNQQVPQLQNPQNQFSQIPQQPISMLVNEKTRLPDKIIGFQEVEIDRNWVQQSQVQPSRFIQSQIAYQQPIPNPVQRNQSQPITSKIVYSSLKQTPMQRNPQYLQCKWCNYEGMSEVEFHIGFGTITLAMLFAMFIVGFLFLFCKNCKDCVHYCSNCSCEMGTVKFPDMKC